MNGCRLTAVEFERRADEGRNVKQRRKRLSEQSSEDGNPPFRVDRHRLTFASIVAELEGPEE